jgi:hypothetical protein
VLDQLVGFGAGEGAEDADGLPVQDRDDAAERVGGLGAVDVGGLEEEAALEFGEKRPGGGWMGAGAGHGISLSCCASA